MKKINNYILEKLHIGKDYNPYNTPLNFVKKFYLEKFEEYIKSITVYSDDEDIEYPEAIKVRLILKNKMMIPIRDLKDSIDEACKMLKDKKYNYEYADLGQGFLPNKPSEFAQYVILGKR